MKHIPVILVLCLMLSPGASAESTHADDFITGLSKARDGLIGMAGDAANSVTQWANDTGVSDWMQKTAGSVTDWAKESGLTDWAQGALKDVTVWADDSGFTKWAQDVSAQVKAMVEENGPAVDAWLKAAGEEVNRAWTTLSNADQHTAKEVRDALETVNSALGKGKTE